MRKMFVAILIIVFAMSLVSCASTKDREMKDAQKKFCDNVYKHEGIFITENPNLTPLTKQESSKLLHTAVGKSDPEPEPEEEPIEEESK